MLSLAARDAIVAAIARLDSHKHFLLNGVDSASVAWTATNTQGNAHRELTNIDSSTNERIRTDFSIIGHISAAGGLGPNGEFEVFNQHLTENKLAKGHYIGQLVRPLDTDIVGEVNLASMWDEHVVPFCGQIETAARPGDVTSWQLFPLMGTNGLRFKQKMFEVGLSSDGPSFDNWQFNYACRKIINDHPGLRTSHKILRLKAWNADDSMIKPAQAKFLLDGALVEIHFSLENWNIGPTVKDDVVTKPSSSSISAQMHSIDILDVKPRTVRAPNSPQKKRKAQVEGGGGGPAKKRNIVSD